MAVSDSSRENNVLTAPVQMLAHVDHVKGYVLSFHTKCRPFGAHHFPVFSLKLLQTRAPNGREARGTSPIIEAGMEKGVTTPNDYGMTVLQPTRFTNTTI